MLLLRKILEAEDDYQALSVCVFACKIFAKECIAVGCVRLLQWKTLDVSTGVYVVTFCLVPCFFREVYLQRGRVDHLLTE